MKGNGHQKEEHKRVPIRRTSLKAAPARREQAGEFFESVQREMNRMFEPFFRGWGMGSSLEKMRSGWETQTPRVDVSETDKAIQVTAELPGMEEKDIEILLSKDRLTLKGEKKSESEEKDKRYYRMERSYGSFHREIPLPAEIAPDKAEAAFIKGILNITLPKTVESQRTVKRIHVRSE